MRSLAVLVSGTGTLLEAMIADKIPIGVVIADRPCCALHIAQEHGIACELVARTDFVVRSQEVGGAGLTAKAIPST